MEQIIGRADRGADAQGPTGPVSAASTEAALVAALAAFAGVGGIDLVDEGDLRRTVAPGRPWAFLNAVFDLRLDPATAAGRLAEVQAAYRALGLPATFWVTPGSLPIELPRLLTSAGLALHEEEVGMAVDLTARPATVAVAPSGAGGLVIEQVTRPTDLDAWVGVIAASYGWVDAAKSRTLASLYHPAADPPPPGIQVLARQDGSAVGCASLFEVEGLAWVTNIGTIPAARGRGVGTALTQACLRLARERSHAAAYLAASAMGAPVYRRLGFVDTCRFQLYS